MLSTNFTFWLCWSALSIIQKCCRSCGSAVVHASALSHEAKALSIMWQRCRSCDSAVDHVSALSYDAKALSIMWQHCRSCDSTVDHLTALSIMWQHCRSCDRTVDVMQQSCWSCNSAVIDVTALLTWCDSIVDHRSCDSAVDHATVLSFMWQCRRINDGTVAWTTALLHDWQCCCITLTALSHVWRRAVRRNRDASNQTWQSQEDQPVKIKCNQVGPTGQASKVGLNKKVDGQWAGGPADNNNPFFTVFPSTIKHTRSPVKTIITSPKLGTQMVAISTRRSRSRRTTLNDAAQNDDQDQKVHRIYTPKRGTQ